MTICDKHKSDPAPVYGECVGCEIDGLRKEIERLQADLKIASARAAYWEHDADCCGGCAECLRLARELEAAEKVRAM